jgi:hypothetical protein
LSTGAIDIEIMRKIKKSSIRICYPFSVTIESRERDTDKPERSVGERKGVRKKRRSKS